MSAVYLSASLSEMPRPDLLLDLRIEHGLMDESLHQVTRSGPGMGEWFQRFRQRNVIKTR